jgi:WD40 repeat protein
MHIDEDSNMLISGHKDGSAALWDLSHNKLLKAVSDLHETAVAQVRIHVVESKN